MSRKSRNRPASGTTADRPGRRPPALAVERGTADEPDAAIEPAEALRRAMAIGRTAAPHPEPALDAPRAPSPHPAAIPPRTAAEWCTRAATLDRQGAKREAIAAYRQAIAVSPRNAAIHNNLGAILKEVGELDAAAEAFGRAVRLDPRLVVAVTNLGSVLMQSGRSREAIDCFRRAARLRPGEAGAHARLGAALLSVEGPHAALEPLCRAVALEPRLAEAHCLLGEAQRRLGAFDAAIAAFDAALALDPGFAAAHANRGAALHGQGRAAEAAEACRRAVACDPQLAEAHNNLGAALRTLGRLTEAERAYRAAVEARPDFTDAQANLAGTLKDLGRLDEAIATYRQVLALDPGHAEADSNLLMAVHYHPEWSREAIFAEYARWNATRAAPLAARHPRPPLPSRNDGKIRIGLISGGFMRHPVGYLTVGALEAIDRDAFDLVFYTESPRADELTARLRAVARDWVPVFAMADEAVARRMREDRLDILVDLHDGGGSRQLICAYRPAPIQVKWVGGLIDTTGLEVMDYLLSDAVETPPGDEPWYVERLVRLPDGYVSYDPPAHAPPVAPLPALAAGAVTFGCFNNFAKINGTVVDLWSALLRRIDGSRLVLKASQLADAPLRARVFDAFAERGVRRDRIALQGRSPHAGLLAAYGRVDIALDPWPYSGGLTTCEALWMGVPVVTLPGPTFAGRHSASHLANVGLEDWIVADRDAYVGHAAAWAADLPRLARLRDGLRERVRRSPLCDHARFARNLEAAFRAMVRDAADGPGSEQSPSNGA